MKTIKSMLLIIATVSLAVSCQKIGTSYSRSRIRVNAAVAGITKASEITSGTIDAFTLDVVRDGGNAYIKGMQVKKSGSQWKTYDASGANEAEYFWLDDVNMNFWGFAPSATSGTLSVVSQSPMSNPNEMTFDYLVADSVSSQDDLLISYNGENRNFFDEDEAGEQVKVDNADNKVDVVFHHALAKVLFAVSTNDGTYSTDTGISAISLVDVPNGGRCLATGGATDLSFAWTPADGTSSYTLMLGTDFSTIASTGDSNWAPGTYSKNGESYNIFSTKESFFMIPADFSTKSAKIGVTFKRGSETGTKYVAIDDVWEAGKYYKYKISAQNAIGDIYLACELIVSDWVDGSTNIDL